MPWMLISLPLRLEYLEHRVMILVALIGDSPLGFTIALVYVASFFLASTSEPCIYFYLSIHLDRDKVSGFHCPSCQLVALTTPI